MLADLFDTGIAIGVVAALTAASGLLVLLRTPGTLRSRASAD